MEKGTLEPIERETKFTLLRVNALLFKTTRSINIFAVSKHKDNFVYLL